MEEKIIKEFINIKWIKKITNTIFWGDVYGKQGIGDKRLY